MESSNRMNDAFRYMTSKHGLQKRKGNGEYYTEHPRRVASYVWLFKSSYRIEDLLIIALLHDVIEDTNGTAAEIEELFGHTVANTVVELTSITKEQMEIQGEAKKDYLAKKMTTMTPYALVVKLCDRLDNIKSLKGMNDSFKFRQVKDTEYILTYLYKTRTFLTRTHHILMAEILKEIDNLSPQSELQRQALIVPEEIDLGFEFDSLVNALDDETREQLSVEIDNISTLLNKVKEVNK